MTTSPLQHWEQYLLADDYQFLTQYLENVMYDIPNNKMILLSGPGRTGKSTLQNDIRKYMEGIPMLNACSNLPFNDLAHIKSAENLPKLGVYCELADIATSKKKNQAIIDLIKKKQSLIAATSCIEIVHPELLEHSRIIEMNHVF